MLDTASSPDPTKPCDHPPIVGQTRHDRLGATFEIIDDDMRRDCFDIRYSDGRVLCQDYEIIARFSDYVSGPAARNQKLVHEYRVNRAIATFDGDADFVSLGALADVLRGTFDTGEVSDAQQPTMAELVKAIGHITSYLTLTYESTIKETRASAMGEAISICRTILGEIDVTARTTFDDLMGKYELGGEAGLETAITELREEHAAARARSSADSGQILLSKDGSLKESRDNRFQDRTPAPEEAAPSTATSSAPGYTFIYDWNNEPTKEQNEALWAAVTREADGLVTIHLPKICEALGVGRVLSMGLDNTALDRDGLADDYLDLIGAHAHSYSPNVLAENAYDFADTMIRRSAVVPDDVKRGREYAASLGATVSKTGDLGAARDALQEAATPAPVVAAPNDNLAPKVTAEIVANSDPHTWTAPDDRRDRVDSYRASYIRAIEVSFAKRGSRCVSNTNDSANHSLAWKLETREQVGNNFPLAFKVTVTSATESIWAGGNSIDACISNLYTNITPNARPKVSSVNLFSVTISPIQIEVITGGAFCWTAPPL